MSKNTEARLRANAKYDEKTYSSVVFRLNNDRDKHLIEGFKEAKEHGYTYREYLRQLFNVAK